MVVVDVGGVDAGNGKSCRGGVADVEAHHSSGEGNGQSLGKVVGGEYIVLLEVAAREFFFPEGCAAGGKRRAHGVCRVSGGEDKFVGTC